MRPGRAAGAGRGVAPRSGPLGLLNLRLGGGAARLAGEAAGAGSLGAPSGLNRRVGATSGKGREGTAGAAVGTRGAPLAGGGRAQAESIPELNGSPGGFPPSSLPRLVFNQSKRRGGKQAGDRGVPVCKGKP